MKHVELFKMDTNSDNNIEYFGTLVSPMIYKRHSAGICFDKLSQQVYCGGGEQEGLIELNTIEYYNINENNWINLPKTKYKYSNYPILCLRWNGRILCIASDVTKCMEWIDIRENKKKWNIEYDGNLNHLFGGKELNGYSNVLV